MLKMSLNDGIHYGACVVLVLVEHWLVNQSTEFTPSRLNTCFAPTSQIVAARIDSVKRLDVQRLIRVQIVWVAAHQD